ncbi:MAG: hypothetical protein H6713_20435 [Myxococcales bacterium]|nr:hypothetical protein [Myxococcales bacterium]
MTAATSFAALVGRLWLPCGLALTLAACDLDEVDVKDQQGGAYEVEGKAGKKILTAPDGTKYTVKPGGTIIGPDGKATKIKRDGTIVQPDGTRVKLFEDGTKTKLKIEGAELGTDGKKVLVHEDGSKTIIQPDGTVERVFKDGTKTKLQAKTDKPVEKTDGDAKTSQEGAG